MNPVLTPAAPAPIRRRSGVLVVLTGVVVAVDGGELVVSRADLEREAWKVSVPDEFEARIRAAGVVPPTG